MYRLVVTELAHQDLDNIVSYISVQLANPTAAGSFLDEVDACYHFLMSNPLMYEKCRDVRLGAEGYKKVVIKNYIAVYQVNEQTKSVIILRFFYGAQDYIKLI